MTESYWYLRATQAEQQIERVRTRLGWRAKGKSLDHAIDELLTDYARTSTELSAFLHKLLRSSVFTDAERQKYEAAATSKARAKAAIDWAQGEIDKRKEAA